MTYNGHIKNGVAILDTPVTLPDGTRVRIEIEPANSEFSTGKTVEELAREQGTQPISSLAALAIDWPEDESVDELLALVREVRN